MTKLIYLFCAAVPTVKMCHFIVFLTKQIVYSCSSSRQRADDVRRGADVPADGGERAAPALVHVVGGGRGDAGAAGVAARGGPRLAAGRAAAPAARPPRRRHAATVLAVPPVRYEVCSYILVFVMSGTPRVRRKYYLRNMDKQRFMDNFFDKTCFIVIE